MYDEYLEFAKQLAYKAGDIMRAHFQTQLKIDLKEGDEIVTIADQKVNDMVIENIKKTYPTHGVHGEEDSHNLGAEYLWVCDPIDGTNPFAMELPISVFSLALVVDGKPVAGVIYEPNTDRLYWARVGSGAFMNEDPISVDPEGFGAAKRLNFDWWPTAPYDILTPLKKLSDDTKVYMLSPGSTTHMAALVARGEFVASLFAGAKNYDIAAAKVIVEEAGGKVTDFFGNEQRYDQPIKGALVSNGVVHDQILHYLKKDLKDQS